MSYLQLGLGIVFGAIVLGFLLYFAGRMIGAGAARSWFEMHKNLKQTGGQDNGKNDC